MHLNNYNAKRINPPLLLVANIIINQGNNINPKPSSPSSIFSRFRVLHNRGSLVTEENRGHRSEREKTERKKEKNEKR